MRLKLKLFRPVVCCKEFQGWTWIGTYKSWANFFKFQCYTRKITKKLLCLLLPDQTCLISSSHL